MAQVRDLHNGSHALTHLHVHSHYTLLGATARVEDLAARAADDGMAHLALTDSHVLYGAVAFSRACGREGVQPIVGMTVGVCPPEGIGEVGRSPGEVVLLAKNPAGWRSLCALSSALQNRPDREQQVRRGLAWETLAAQRNGLICLMGGRRSSMARAMPEGKGAAARLVSRLAGLFGEDAVLTLELQTPDDDALASAVIELGNRFGLAVAAVHPVYCLRAEEQERLPLLGALAQNCRIHEVDLAALPAGGDPKAALYWLSPAELAERYAAYPQALAGIAAVTAVCAPALPDGRPLWPVLPWVEPKTPDAALQAWAEAGMAARFPAAAPAVAARLQHELALIHQRGVAPLFLLVADITRFAASREIPFNTRGSVANSLVAYCTGITTVDPVAHNLLFERFLNPERANLPDIDLDLCSRRRDEVLHYVRSTYGPEQVALVATMATLRPKSAVRETAKAYGLDEAAISFLVGLVRDEWHPDPRRRSQDPLAETLAKVNDPQHAAVITAAFTLVGVPHHLSIHPGGVVVAPGAVTEVAPLQWTPKGFAVVQFAHEDVETLGLPKIDLLGIRALTVVADTVRLVREHHAPGFRLSDISPDDSATAALLAAGDTIGVFQCESWGARRTLRQLEAATVADLAVANAFFKPGPATGGMAAAFVRRYRGEEAVSYLHPALAPILGPTQGVMLFQEQVLRVAREIAGLSWREADLLRRGMSKFRAAEMAVLQQAFVDGCVRPHPDGAALSANQAQTLWRQVMAFAGYGFNQGHATAYADVSYRSAYLKAHWPAEYLCARLADWGGFHHQAVYLAEARRLGIVVRPPHINTSQAHFHLIFEGEQGQAVLWMGLGQVRDLRRSTVQAMLAARRARPFASVEDLAVRVSMQHKEWLHLIQCGGLDGLGESRAAMASRIGATRAGDGAQQMAFDFVTQAIAPESALQRLQWEQRILGLPVSVHPCATVAAGSGAGLDAARAGMGRVLEIDGTRLPGWTGDKGWFFDDGRTYAVAIGQKGLPTPRPWRPIRVRGAWCSDNWGDAWLQVEAWQPLDR